MSRTGKAASGFTFVEVMVTLAILSSGIVLIYKSFFLCADYLSRLSCRLQAGELIDARIADLGRGLKENGSWSFSPGPSVVTRQINHKTVDFTYRVDKQAVPGFEDVWQVAVSVSWPESGHAARFARSAVLSL